MRCISSLRIAPSSRAKLAPPYSSGHVGTVRPRATQRSSQSFCASDRNIKRRPPQQISSSPGGSRISGGQLASSQARSSVRSTVIGASSLSAGSDLRAGSVHGPLDFVDGRASAPLWPSPISARIEVSGYDLDGAARAWLGRRPPRRWAVAHEIGAYEQERLLRAAEPTSRSQWNDGSGLSPRSFARRPRRGAIRPKPAFISASAERREGWEAALGRTAGAGGIADEVAASPRRLISQQVIREALGSATGGRSSRTSPACSRRR